MEYEKLIGKTLEVINNSRRFSKIKDVMENFIDDIKVTTADDLTYSFTLKELNELITNNTVVRPPENDLFYLHDFLPENYFTEKMSEAERLWHTFGRMRNNAEILKDRLDFYYMALKYWLHSGKREENAKYILDHYTKKELEQKLADITAQVCNASDEVIYPDFFSTSVRDM